MGGGLGGVDFCYFGGRDGGDLVTRLSGGWPSGTTLMLYGRWTGASGEAYEIQSRVVFGGGSARRCALGLLGMLQSSFLLMHGDLVIGTVVENADGSADLRLTILNDPIERGFLIACGSFGDGGGGTLPGDANLDGRVDLSDPVRVLGYLFLGTPTELPCGESGGVEPDPADLRLLDVDDSGSLDLTDPVRLLNYLFLGGPEHALGSDCIDIEGCREACVP